mmetsp:Transcript_34864/g.54501  ORF Transcript_34864/g.54501 Transcript_34864/m.54501 type:complete len:146 (-) Transcript_34864:71-508(-)
MLNRSPQQAPPTSLSSYYQKIAVSPSTPDKIVRPAKNPRDVETPFTGRPSEDLRQSSEADGGSAMSTPRAISEKDEISSLVGAAESLCASPLKATAPSTPQGLRSRGSKSVTPSRARGIEKRALEDSKAAGASPDSPETSISAWA